MTTDDLRRTSRDLRERIELSWQAFRPLVDTLTPEQLAAPTTDGRSVTEALAAVAFWNETCAPVFAWLRGQSAIPVESWYGGDDLAIPDGAPWPRDDVHHAREAVWARTVSAATVSARLDAAHAAAATAVGTLTTEATSSQAAGDVSAETRSDGRGDPPTGGSDNAVHDEPGDADGVPADHPWATMTAAERMLDKAAGCTYRLYDDLRAEIERILVTTSA
jgi:hypothetical protein